VKLWQKSLLMLFAVSIAASAQEPSPNSMVKVWTEGTVSPAATIKDVLWEIGDWQGPVEGSLGQSTVFPPTKGHMPGFARSWAQDGTIRFYEINDIVEVNGSLECRVKHFTGNLAAWEGKDEYVRHRLIQITDKAAYFDGLTVVKEGPDHLTVYVLIRDGERKGQVFVVHEARMRK
jgi:hypothetical protein